MSYLLTEIALEMLGYKFYDTNGDFHLTNFQQSMAAVQNDVHPEEPSLAEFIDQPSSSEQEQNGNATNNATSSSGSSTSSMVPSTKSAIQVDFRRTPIRAIAKMMANDSDKINNGHEPQQAKQLGSSDTSATLTVLPKMSAKPRKLPTKALARILEYESFTIRSQIAQRLEIALKRKVKSEKEVLNEEKRKILEDAENMHNFRLFLENRLRGIESRPFGTYMKTFGM